MAPQRRGSNLSENGDDRTQELGSMYDYLAKVILLGPSGAGKSVSLAVNQLILGSFLSGRVLASQTIGVEFASKIIKVGTGARRKRIKLQLWDTAGTERFRSVSRSYYRGAAGAILVYDITSHDSFNALPTFFNDARALASPQLILLLAGNKVDLTLENTNDILGRASPPPSRSSMYSSATLESDCTRKGSIGYGVGSQLTATVASDGRQVTLEEASRWASKSAIPVAVEVSAYNGDGVDDVFTRLATMILTKIELGEIDPDDPQSGIQYGDSGGWDGDAGSVRSGATSTLDSAGVRRRTKSGQNDSAWGTGMREWEAVFSLDGVARRRRKGCC